MISSNFICSLLIFTCIIISGRGNVIRQDESIYGIFLSTDDDIKERNSADDDKVTFSELTRLIQLDDSPKLKLKDGHFLRIGIEHISHHKSSVHHFARHGVCRNERGKARLYAALKSKLCNTKREFIAQLVEDLCESRGNHLDNWIAELFDINGDGIIGHFEKMFYDD